MRELRARPRVLGLEVGQDLGVLVVAQPLVVVDDDVAVVLARERPALGHGGLGGRDDGGGLG